MVCATALAVLALLLQADVRAKVAEREERERAALATEALPGIDSSEAALRADAARFCGTTDECISRYKQHHDSVFRLYALQPSKRKKIVRALTAAKVDGRTDWVEVSDRAIGMVTLPPLRPSTRIRCSTRTTRRQTYSTCTTW